MNNDNNIELLKNIFKDGFTHKPAGIFPAEAVFTFSSQKIAEFQTKKSLKIQGEIDVSQNTEEGTLGVFCAEAASDVLKNINADSKLPAAIRFDFGAVDSSGADNQPLTFHSAGVARVDSGMLNVATSEFQSTIEQAEEAYENSNDDSSDFTESLESSKIPGFKFTHTEINSFVLKNQINDEESLDIVSGYGDGEYPVFLGKDSQGVVRVVYIDFMLFDRPDVVEQLLSTAQ